MKKNYINMILCTAFVVGITAVTYAQGSKVKTITIVNGDTSITETNLNEKDLAKMEKEIRISLDGDEKGTKKIVKKIIIDDEKEGEAMAYAYAIGDEAEDVEVITTEDGKEMKVVVKSKVKGGKDDKDKTRVVKKEVYRDGAAREKSKVSLNINIENTTARINVVTGSSEPLSISILDENGKQVFHDTQKNGEKYSKEIPLGKKGTYFLNLIQNKASTMEKIIVE